VDNENKQPITRMSSLDLSLNSDDIFNSIVPDTNILDNYDLTNANYTKGIQISQCTFNGSNNFSIWEFSGYEPYKVFYDNFIGDLNSIHVIVYDLNKKIDNCFEECVYWLEYLRSRLVKVHQNQSFTVKQANFLVDYYT
jgi:hypothetical protein